MFELTINITELIIIFTSGFVCGGWILFLLMRIRSTSYMEFIQKRENKKGKGSDEESVSGI